MKAILVEKIGSFLIRDLPMPEPGEGEVLVKVLVTGLCKTDLKLIRLGHRDLLLPRVPGEEVVGKIDSVGPDVRNYSKGQRVYVYPGTSCGRCELCLRGAENLCQEMKIMGFHRHGGFGEYVLAPVNSLIPVPESLMNDEAVFAEPLSCCLNALELCALGHGETIGIWGGGPAGTLLNRAASALGAIPFVMEPDKHRRSLIRGFEKPAEEAFDVCVVAVGALEAYEQALSHLKSRGRLVVFSGLPKEAHNLLVDLNRLHYFEHTLVGAYGCSYRHGKQALEFLREGKVYVSDMVSHRMSLWELEDALQLVEKRKGMKILLYPNEV